MKLIHFVLLMLLGISFTKLRVLNLQKKCFLPQGRDTSTFGFSLAMSDDYLAVGDPEANRVVIYSRKESHRWVRTKEIVPPTDSTTHRIGSGFGYDLALDEDTLVIGAYSQKQDVENAEDFQLNEPIVSTSGAVYQTNLGRDSIVKRLDDFKQGEIVGNVVAAGGGVVAFTSSKIEPEQPYNAINKIVVLVEGQRKFLPSPTDNRSWFDADIAIHDKMLLAGSIAEGRDKAWLFNLDDEKSLVPHPIQTSAEDLVGNSVALSKEFIVVSEKGGSRYSDIVGASPKTLIERINRDNRTIIDGHAEVSLDNKILSRLRFGRVYYREANNLELFYLDDNATPRRILKRENVKKALVKNSLLTTVQEKSGKALLCIEPISSR